MGIRCNGLKIRFRGCPRLAWYSPGWSISTLTLWVTSLFLLLPHHGGSAATKRRSLDFLFRPSYAEKASAPNCSMLQRSMRAATGGHRGLKWWRVMAGRHGSTNGSGGALLIAARRHGPRPPGVGRSFASTTVRATSCRRPTGSRTDRNRSVGGRSSSSSQLDQPKRSRITILVETFCSRVIATSMSTSET